MDPGWCAVSGHTKRLAKRVNSTNEGFEISVEKLIENPNLVTFIRENNNTLPNLHLVGTGSITNDKALFELITRYCTNSAKKLKFSWMTINIPFEKLQPFALLKEVTFDTCTIENESILNFNRWCPNVANLIFDEGTTLSHSALDALKSSTQALPHVKSLSIDFKSSSLKLTREWLAVLNQQFPQLENLELTLKDEDSFNGRTLTDTYQPLYFSNLKKLSVQAFGNDIDKLFDYMAISNKKLKELIFIGLVDTQELYDWIKSCKKLQKLTVDCRYLTGYMSDVTDMPLVKELKLEAKKLDMEPNEIIQTARNLPRLNLLDIVSDYGNDDIQFGQEYKDMFADLNKERKKLTIKVFFHEEKREIKISEKGFSEKFGVVENDNPLNTMEHFEKCISDILKKTERQVEDLLGNK
ncbi:uncharacterized protein LOC116337096 [Contarinia nasturtii]|uniref:uncharacterized protein LOC116337096 n=1 Tax=Contarinia nasturtii TaxID=265458 RepID=UPI0012D46B4D|nr:uncharacterized protein LOC116337096 [Contarinia nasturtii]